jgi:shikimate dehydrogenase
MSLKYGLLGKNISYSKSPFIYNYWFSKYNINAEYLLIDTDNLTIDFFLNLIENEKFAGLNFTIPYKKFLLQVDTLEKFKKIGFTLNIEEACNFIQGCNFLSIKDKKIEVKNTDYLGLIDSFIENKFDFTNKNILILGASASVLALIYAINNHNRLYKNIYIINRTKEKAHELVKKNNKILHFSGKIEDIDYIFNATSLNFLEALDFFSIDKNIEKPIFYDLNYHFIYKNSKIVKGSSMLLNQAKYNFKNWFGFYPILDNELINNI